MKDCILQEFLCQLNDNSQIEYTTVIKYTIGLLLSAVFAWYNSHAMFNSILGLQITANTSFKQKQGHFISSTSHPVMQLLVASFLVHYAFQLGGGDLCQLRAVWPYQSSTHDPCKNWPLCIDLIRNFSFLFPWKIIRCLNYSFNYWKYSI